MLRTFVAHNNTTESYSINLTITPKSDGFLNFRIPYSSLRATLRPHATVSLLTLVKIFPEVDWAEYDIHCSIQKNDGFGFKARGDEQNLGKRASFNIRKIDAPKIDTSTRNDQKKCSNCKALNSPSYAICKECFFDL